MTLEELDAYLMSDDSPEGCFLLSDLDGFLHGVACSPEAVPTEEWMAVVLGATESELLEAVVKTVANRYAEICQLLAEDDPELEPIFWQNRDGDVIAMDWCEGFMAAVALRPQKWLRLTESGTHGQLMTPIIAHLVDDQGESVLGIPVQVGQRRPVHGQGQRLGLERPLAKSWPAQPR